MRWRVTWRRWREGVVIYFRAELLARVTWAVALALGCVFVTVAVGAFARCVRHGTPPLVGSRIPNYKLYTYKQVNSVW